MLARRIVALLLLLNMAAPTHAQYGGVDPSEFKDRFSQLGRQAADDEKNKAEAEIRAGKARDVEDEEEEDEDDEAGKADEKDMKRDVSKKPRKKRVVPVLSELERYFAKSLGKVDGPPLRQFGYQAFVRYGKTFFPAEEIPVGPDYIIGPGDTLNVTLWGISEGQFTVTVNREGKIVLPRAGAVNVGGELYGKLRDVIEKQLSRYFEQVNVDVTLASLKSIRVYVVGELKNPGSFAISPLTTAYGALFVAKGPTKTGTLRNIQIIRNGRTVATMDLYRFLQKGDKGQDIPLQSGDTIFVPLLGDVVAVSGNVYRPGIFEVRNETDLQDALKLAGGLLPTSYLNRVQLERVVAHQKKMILDKKLPSGKQNGQLGIPIRNMDLVKVYPIYATLENVVILEGGVKYPGTYEWREGMRVRDLLPTLEHLSTGAYFPRMEIVRTSSNSGAIEIIEVDVNQLFSQDPGSANQLVQPRDQIVVLGEKTKIVRVSLKGEFRIPGDYVVRKGERLSSVIERAGGFTPEAYVYGAVFTRESAKTAQEEAYREHAQLMEKAIIGRQKEVDLSLLPADERKARIEQLERNFALLQKLGGGRNMVGRLIIRLSSDLDKLRGSQGDIEMEDGDELMVPREPHVVNVLGEVYSPSAVNYIPSRSTSYYIALVGGETKMADRLSLYIIRADGTIVSRDQGVNIALQTIYPGDSILVPGAIDRFSFWTWLREMTHWIYEATLATAVLTTALRR